MAQAARVTKITERGDVRMREAIAQGLITGELKSDVERALHESELVRRENGLLRNRNIELEAIRREDAHRHSAAYKARLDQRGLMRDMKGLIIVAAILTAMLTITIASIILAAI